MKANNRQQRRQRQRHKQRPLLNRLRGGSSQCSRSRSSNSLRLICRGCLSSGDAQPSKAFIARRDLPPIQASWSLAMKGRINRIPPVSPICSKSMKTTKISLQPFSKLSNINNYCVTIQQKLQRWKPELSVQKDWQFTSSVRSRNALAILNVNLCVTS